MDKKLYIRNLHDLIDSDALEELFSSVGNVYRATVEIKQVRGNDYRVGYVEMSSVQEALDCIDRFHGQKVHGLEMVVTEDKPHVAPAALLKKKSEARKNRSKARA